MLPYLLAIWAVLFGARAHASEGEIVERAERAERELRFADAERAWAELERASSGGRLARRARARLDWLRARKAGDYGPLTEITRVRRDGATSAADVARLEALAASFPTGPLRREARALVAESYLRLDRPLDALRAHESWLAEPDLEQADWIRATNGLARARARLGDLGGALETLRRHGLGHHAEAAHLKVELVRRWARPLAWTLLVLFALWVFGRRLVVKSPLALRAVCSPAGVAAALWVIGVPALLAYRHGAEAWRTMAWLTPGALAVVLASAVAGTVVAGAPRAVRVGTAAWAVAAQLAVAYLALDRSGTLLAWAIALELG